MARSLGYTPPTPPDTSATDEVDDLVRALHESGLMRAVTGAVRTYPQLLDRLLSELDAATLRSVIALGGAARGLEPDGSARLAAGIRQARHDAAVAAASPPPGPVALWRRLRDPRTRRGLAAALAALAAVGGALSAPQDRGEGSDGD